MGIFGPSRRQIAKMSQEIAEMERAAHSGMVSEYPNPPKHPLDRSVEWMVFDGGFLPTANGALQHDGELGVLFCAAAKPGERQPDVWLSKMVPNISVFMSGKVLREAFAQGWLREAIRTRRYLSEIEGRFPQGSLIFHYHFDLHPSEVSPEAIQCFNVAWPDYLRRHGWDSFRQALHAGELLGAPSWWQAQPLAPLGHGVDPIRDQAQEVPASANPRPYGLFPRLVGYESFGGWYLARLSCIEQAKLELVVRRSEGKETMQGDVAILENLISANALPSAPLLGHKYIKREIQFQGIALYMSEYSLPAYQATESPEKTRELMQSIDRLQRLIADLDALRATIATPHGGASDNQSPASPEAFEAQNRTYWSQHVVAAAIELYAVANAEEPGTIEGLRDLARQVERPSKTILSVVTPIVDGLDIDASARPAFEDLKKTLEGLTSLAADADEYEDFETDVVSYSQWFVDDWCSVPNPSTL